MFQRWKGIRGRKRGKLGEREEGVKNDQDVIHMATSSPKQMETVYHRHHSEVILKRNWGVALTLL